MVVDPSAQVVEDHHVELRRQDGSWCFAPMLRTTACSASLGQELHMIQWSFRSSLPIPLT